MRRLFDDRERAAEAAFAHDEELRFLIRRRAYQTLSAWVAECMALDGEATKAYEGKIVGLLVAGWPDERLLQSVQTDLERAGKPTLSMEVGTTFSRALAHADGAVRGIVGKTAGVNAEAKVDALDTWGQRHPSTESSWGTFRL